MKKTILFIAILVTLFSSCKKGDDTSTSASGANDIQKPVAEFRISNLINGNYVTEGKNLKLENLSKNAVSYLWDFGNGVQFNSRVPGKTYYIPCGGNYTISLTAINSAGEKSIFTKNITVLCSGKNHNQYSGD